MVGWLSSFFLELICFPKRTNFIHGVQQLRIQSVFAWIVSILFYDPHCISCMHEYFQVICYELFTEKKQGYKWNILNKVLCQKLPK